LPPQAVLAPFFFGYGIEKLDQSLAATNVLKLIWRHGGFVYQIYRRFASQFGQEIRGPT
jgi:hypothetical protein